MHFSPILALKALKQRFPQLSTWRKCKVGQNAILGLSRAEMVRNTCFQSNIVSVTYDWAVLFFVHTGVWKANSLGVHQKCFPRESKTKIAFPRGSGQVFQRGDDS